MTRSRRRSAFTLVELLVVIAIIGVLLALTVTAVFGARKGQMKSNSEATLSKLDGKLLTKMKEMQDSIANDYKNRGDIPEVRTLKANLGENNPDVVKAVMLYGRTRQQFPMTFTEASTNAVVCGHTYPPLPAFRGLPASGTGTQEESAACLYAALAQTGLVGLENQQGTNSTGQQVFTDAFGSPIAFVRMGFDGNQNELNAPNRAFDPFYPAKTPAGAYRNLKGDYTPGPAAFETQVWDVVRPNVAWLTNTPADYPNPANFPTAGSPAAPLKNHTAFVFSAGPNKLFIDAPTETSIYAGDNLFSYRLRREGAGGD